MTPQRVQRTRKPGAKLPPNTMCVTRPGPHGNPFKVGGHYLLGDRAGGNVIYMESYANTTDERYEHPTTAAECVAMYERYIKLLPKKSLEEKKAALRGKNLACWCPVGSPCHADVLLRVVNED